MNIYKDYNNDSVARFSNYQKKDTGNIMVFLNQDNVQTQTTEEHYHIYFNNL